MADKAPVRSSTGRPKNPRNWRMGCPPIQVRKPLTGLELHQRVGSVPTNRPTKQPRYRPQMAQDAQVGARRYNKCRRGPARALWPSRRLSGSGAVGRRRTLAPAWRYAAACAGLPGLAACRVLAGLQARGPGGTATRRGEGERVLSASAAVIGLPTKAARDPDPGPPRGAVGASKDARNPDRQNFRSAVLVCPLAFGGQGCEHGPETALR